jgi:hypothetical protein
MMVDGRRWNKDMKLLEHKWHLFSVSDFALSSVRVELQRVSVSEMKKQKTKHASTRQRREAEGPLPVPTLEQVAEEEDFAPLRGLIQPVARRPVNELSEELRGVLRKKAGDDLELLLVSFFAACDARAREIERKRAHVASGEKSPGKQRRERLDCFFLSAVVVCVSSFFARELVVISVKGGARAVRADQGSRRLGGERAGRASQGTAAVAVQSGKRRAVVRARVLRMVL